MREDRQVATAPAVLAEEEDPLARVLEHQQQARSIRTLQSVWWFFLSREKFRWSPQRPVPLYQMLSSQL